MPDIYYKSPLTIYVIWHPSTKDGLKYAEIIYNTFCRDTFSPLSRGLGIPVRFRYQIASDSKFPIGIDPTLSDRNAVILLIDEEMFMDRERDWYDYIQVLLDQEKQHKDFRVIPVAFSPYAFSIDEQRLNKKQFINLSQIEYPDEQNTFLARAKELKSRLLHDLCRIFFQRSLIADVEKQKSSPPIKLFISHAKLDGEKLAIDFKNYIISNKKLKTFFDTNDIGDADDFEEELLRNLKSSAAVVLLSDQYSTREWCRIEVIVAKRCKSPLVVVNNLQSGERRSFPYMGNVPTIQYKQGCFDEVIDLALFQVLNNLYLDEKLKKEIALYGLSERFKTIYIQNAPELFNYIDIKRLQNEEDRRKIVVIYPDPPLGTEELRILNDLDPNIDFITPSLIHKVVH